MYVINANALHVLISRSWWTSIYTDHTLSIALKYTLKC